LNRLQIGERRSGVARAVLVESDPHAVVRIALLAEDEDDPLAQIDPGAAEHRACRGPELAQRIQHEIVGNLARTFRAMREDVGLGALHRPRVLRIA